ncbi:MAG: site-specific DNA-methyltransferase, partial [Candidatus Obscuribacterales bacterium]|nr:site-specific DNA-methyltransferase [Candidatus Obscuribacterales bacterium]
EISRLLTAASERTGNESRLVVDTAYLRCVKQIDDGNSSIGNNESNDVGGACIGTDELNDVVGYRPGVERQLDLRSKILHSLMTDSVGIELDGVLVNADNRKVLAELQKTHRGKVRFIYIDPPYNTCNPDLLYDDSFERVDWLAYMKECLTAARELLGDCGSIAVSIDDRELPYLRILLDHVFSETAFVACIAYERSGSAGLGQAGIIANTKEYVLLYSLDRSRLYEVASEKPLDRQVMKRYNKVLVDSGRRELVEEFESSKSGNLVRLYKHEDCLIDTISLRSFESRYAEILAQYIDRFYSVFRTQNVQKENTFQNEIIGKLEKKVFYSIDYVPRRGKYKGEDKTLYYWNGELCAWLKDSSKLRGGEMVKQNKLTDIWTHADIPKADLANEGGVNFPRSKKPEHLLYRLISMTTRPGDLVLDFFAGSGTTCAVAHKMGRKWIGVDNGDFFHDCPLPRMRRVVFGEQSGVSRLAGWKGGGVFAYSSPKSPVLHKPDFKG